MITCKRRIKEFNTIHLKYVDDFAVAEAVNMKEQLTQVPVDSRPQPDTFRDRTGHSFEPENSKVFSQLLKTESYAEENRMKVNYGKTKLMVFNPGKVRDFHPKFNLNNKQLDLVEETKLLGVVIRSDLCWNSNTDYIVSRANKKLWFLRRLKTLGANQDDLRDVYIKQIRSILEFAVPVWHSSLTGEDRLLIERIQKSALHIILGNMYQSSYTSALKLLQLETLFRRRQKLCAKFARKSFKNAKFNKWFKLNDRVTVTRQQGRKFCQVYCRTQRFERSPISYITELLNRAKNIK